MKKRIAIIDCSIETPSSACFERLKQYLDLSLSYYRPPLQMTEPLIKSRDENQGYIIFGSASNIEDQLPWHKELANFCHQELLQSKPIFGICFGHQLMAHYYGATIARNDLNQTYKGARRIDFIDSSSVFSKGESYNLFTSHSFEIKNLPSSIKHIATSSQCFFDGIEHKKLPFISFQGHPEASDYFIDQEIKSSNPDFSSKGHQAFIDGPYLISQWFAKSLQ